VAPQQIDQSRSFVLAHRRRFASTRWSLVCAAAAEAAARSVTTVATRGPSRAAMAELCQSYWYPLYAFVRRRGYTAEEAGDLTQGFFAALLEKNYLADADRTRGRFRTFLLTSMKHYLANEHDRAVRLKRGGGRAILPLEFDLGHAESRYRTEPSHRLTPERLFERRWALTLLEKAMDQLRADYANEGKGALFDALKGALTCSDDAESCAMTSRALAMSQGALRVAAHRLRKRYRRCLRGVIADCVESEQEVDEEIRALFAALASAG
jgi:RNA polymerase sigma-70 factor (ECF subfamily)